MDERNGNFILYQVAVVDWVPLPKYFLYAIDIVHATVPNLVEISGTTVSVPGKNPSNPQQANICTSDYPANGPLQFDYNHIQRAALLLLTDSSGNDIVYVPFSPGDGEWENGWLIGYKCNFTAFTLYAAFSPSPYGTGAGIWNSGSGPGSDGTSILIATGNGTFDLNGGTPSSVDAGDTVLKLIPNGQGGMSITGWYAPSDVNTYIPQQGTSIGRCTPPNDVDLGSGGVMIFPDQFYSPPGGQPLSLSVVADKESNLYVMNINSLGGYASNGGVNCGTHNQNGCGNNVETIYTPDITNPPNDQGYWGSGAYWRQPNGGTTKYFLYYSATSHTGSAAPYPIYQYTLQTGASSGPISNSFAVASHLANGASVSFCLYSPAPSVSSHGSSAGGVLWAIESSNSHNIPGQQFSCDGTVGPAVLHAFDPTTMQQVYTSGGNSHITSHATYPTPTIFQGRVYMGTWTEVDVFGPCGGTYPPCLN